MNLKLIEWILTRLYERVAELERQNAALQAMNSELLGRAREAECKLAAYALKKRRVEELIMDIVEN
ncbi:hypothetical protein LG047_15500 [Methylocystis sp. WRRC1]|uniref:hypothetical protein n=1 Tax=Methylocystis sp. WRRC1 TaxID=1732014 RepID=UPI001D14BBD7|nr:hypothetical protein [Methylocystis sp. WRRC1]MCC3246705.1 hypothetical protein [Methylocystis sp. WRRC1]